LGCLALKLTSEIR